MSEFKWNIPIEHKIPTQVGKLKLASFLASEDKYYIDEINQVFQVNFKTGERYYMYSTFKLDGFDFKLKHLPILK